MKFRVNREKWARNGIAVDMGDTALLNEKGNMCCLGFVCNQGGVPEEDLNDIGFPRNLKTLPEKLKFLLDGADEGEYAFEDKAVNINDKDLKPYQKERKLKALFKKAGHEIEFYGRTPRQ